LKSKNDELRLEQAEEILNSLMAIIDGKEVQAYIKQEDGSYKKNPDIPENAKYVWKGESEK
jgi:hypothetical protein